MLGFRQTSYAMLLQGVTQMVARETCKAVLTFLSFEGMLFQPTPWSTRDSHAIDLRSKVLGLCTALHRFVHDSMLVRILNLFESAVCVYIAIQQ